MKKIYSLFLLILISLSLVSCVDSPQETNKPQDVPQEQIKYSITYNINQHGIQPENLTDQTKLPDSLPVLSEGGYTFGGWYTDEALQNEAKVGTTLTANIILYAKWTKQTSSETFTGYYAPMSGHLDDSFKETLHKLLKDTHANKLTYKEVWDALKRLDEDPSNSNNIICIYTGRSIPKANQDTGSAGNNIWNREHAWPNSHGFKSQDYAAYTDIHHLFASEKNINATRGNKDFNYVKNGNSDSYGNKWNGTDFEPRDEVKGDFARAMFYLVARYADSSELVLSLVDNNTSSSSNKTGSLGFLSALLEWHELDPVSEKEIARNELVYEIQGNRNPFIDHPEWVALLYPNA